MSAGGGGVTVVSGFVVEFGLTVLGVADGAFGAPLGTFGAPVGMFGAAVGVWPCALGVTLGLADGSVGMVEELGVVTVGVFVVPGVVLCGLILLCELGLLECAVPRAVPVLEGVLDCAYTQQPHSSTVLAKRLSLRFMFLTFD